MPPSGGPPLESSCARRDPPFGRPVGLAAQHRTHQRVPRPSPRAPGSGTGDQPALVTSVRVRAGTRGRAPRSPAIGTHGRAVPRCGGRHPPVCRSLDAGWSILGGHSFNRPTVPSDLPPIADDGQSPVPLCRRLSAARQRAPRMWLAGRDADAGKSDPKAATDHGCPAFGFYNDACH